MIHGPLPLAGSVICKKGRSTHMLQVQDTTIRKSRYVSLRIEVNRKLAIPECLEGSNSESPVQIK